MADNVALLSADAPDLRLVAQMAGIAPTTLAAVLNDPEFMPRHITADEMGRLVAGIVKLLPILERIRVMAEFLVVASNRLGMNS